MVKSTLIFLLTPHEYNAQRYLPNDREQLDHVNV